MKKYKDFLILILFILIFIELLINRNLIFQTVNQSLDLWVNTLLPTLFPFFIISDILISYNIINIIPKNIKIFLCKLFNINENAISVFLLSLLSGFPSNAKITRTLYDNKKLNKNEASHILMFTHFSNPFFISMISSVFLNNSKITIIILLTQYLSNIILGIIVRNHHYITKSNTITTNYKCQSFPNTLINAIKSSLNSVLLILGTLTSFLIFSKLITNLISLNNYNNTLLNGILELTSGLKSLSLLNIKEIYKVILSSIFITFGGFCIHMQVISQISDTEIKYKPFLIGRILQSFISIPISYLLYILFI